MGGGGGGKHKGGVGKKKPPPRGGWGGGGGPGGGTVLMRVSSVGGCAAGKARPGVRLALEHSVRPDRLATVFAGMEIDATERARGHFIGFPPSSPQIALFSDGQLVHMLERQDIQGRSAEAIASELRSAFDKYCAPASSGERQ